VITASLLVLLDFGSGAGFFSSNFPKNFSSIFFSSFAISFSSIFFSNFFSMFSAIVASSFYSIFSSIDSKESSDLLVFFEIYVVLIGSVLF
jgi:hypothetical protein